MGGLGGLGSGLVWVCGIGVRLCVLLSVLLCVLLAVLLCKLLAVLRTIGVLCV